MNIDKIEKMALLYLPLLENRKKKHVSVVLCKGVPISVGVNRNKTHPTAAKYRYPFDEVHSELDAWLKVKDKSKEYSLLNFRFGCNNEWRMARPCSLCFPWCRSVFNEVFYTTRNGLVREVY